MIVDLTSGVICAGGLDFTGTHIVTWRAAVDLRYQGGRLSFSTREENNNIIVRGK